MTGWLRNVFGADKAADASRAAAAESVAGQEDALRYLQERERIPMELRDQALQGLAAFYQVPGQPMDQAQLIEQAKASPLYQSILGSRRSGEQAILRNASATGGLRSAAPSALAYDYNVQLENRALLDAFNQQQQRQDYERELNLGGLGALAGLRGNEGMIAQTMGNIGETKAQGIVGAGQAEASGMQNAIGTLLGIGSLGAQAGWFSDIRLKEDVRPEGKMFGYDWYRWKWNKTAQDKFGLTGEGVGVIAHHVHESQPEAVTVRDGYLAVDYTKLRAA